MGALFGFAMMAGCLGDGAEATGGDGMDHSPDDVPLDADASLSDCREIGIARLVSFDHARGLLPAGYAPGEAAEFLGMPVPTGGGVVLAGQIECAGSVLDDGPLAWADLLVYVEPPQIPGVVHDEGVAHLYQLAEFTNGEGTLDLLQEVGFAAVSADVAISFTGGPSLPVGSGSVADASGDRLRFEVASAAPQPYELLARFWHETANGTAYFAHDRTPITMFMGAVTACEARAGSLHAEAFGSTDCASDSSGGVFAQLSDFESTFHFLPGVWATGA